MTEITTNAYDDPIIRERFYQALRDFPSNGKPPRGLGNPESSTTEFLLHFGLIEEAETKTPCPQCGTPRVTYHHCKITPAGRFFMSAMGDGDLAPEDRRSAAIGEMQRLGAPAKDWLTRNGFADVREFVDRASTRDVRQWEEFVERQP
jgi:hypothetical protein